jgi:uncharacterized protein (TIGR00255 family)
MGQISGMTGFSRAEGAYENLRWVWEMRSVNGKGLEFRMRLPSGYERLEAKAREFAKARFVRGNIQVSLNLKQDSDATVLRIDHDRIAAILDAGAPLVESGRVAPPSLDGLLGLRGVLDAETEPAEADTAGLDAVILQTLEQAMDDLRAARRGEGDALAGIMAGHVDTIESLTQDAAGSASLRLDAIQDRIAAKFAELLPEGLPEDRLAMEAATLAVKMDVREEVDRLVAHIQSARDLLAQGSPVGRKLDFLSQEFNREANTLCSKSSDSSLTKIGLALKNAVDQLREQVQNVE